MSGGEELSDALRLKLAAFIDPDDDTMPTLNRVDGGFTRVPAESVIDGMASVMEAMYLQAMGDLGRALDTLDRVRALVDAGPDVGAYDSWDRSDYGYAAALSDVEDILDGKEPKT
ncbi:hypothetical protein [Streptomyces sp. NPDC058678]|uniref:hypothetical protein n=1 Tax=Streptomyces sp. NPDC058678 TaxID=3346595 RepID=UPI00365E3BCF